MMEFIILRIPHIFQQIFEQLDVKSLKNSREVKKSWQKSIDSKNFTWIQIIDIPSILKNGNTYLHVAAATRHFNVFEMIPEIEVGKNPTL